MSEPYVAFQVVMMPKETSPNGTIFGRVGGNAGGGCFFRSPNRGAH
jgi:hypothetical protein